MSHDAAAAAARRRRQDEAQGTTPYRPRELAEDWEFKILHSATSLSNKPAALQRILAEEAQAGWKLVEKFDNARIRLKRPASARENDHRCSFDPYRIAVGLSEGGVAALVASGIAGALGLGLLIIFLVTRG